MASAYIREHVAVGDTLDVAAPRGVFFLADRDAPVLLLSAGVGVTPVLAMLHSLAETGSTRPVWWIHGARNSTEHPFAEEASALLKQLPRAHTQRFVQPPPRIRPRRYRLHRIRASVGRRFRRSRPASERGGL